MIRQAVCAGTWYPKSKPEIENYVNLKLKRQKVLAGICPHAGWIYSGKVAGEVFSSIEPAKLYIILGPNHRGNGAPVSVFPNGSWETPLGNLEIDENTADLIVKNSDIAKLDAQAHIAEHSIEVQIPFIKYFSPQAKLVAISLLDYSPQTCKALGQSIAKTIKETDMANETVLIASTDMSHYVPKNYAKQMDSLAVEKILKLDPEGLLKTVKEKDISMCGSGPVAAALWAVKELGAEHAKLIQYSTSGEVTGDYEQVVGYAGMIVF